MLAKLYIVIHGGLKWMSTGLLLIAPRIELRAYFWGKKIDYVAPDGLGHAEHDAYFFITILLNDLVVKYNIYAIVRHLAPKLYCQNALYRFIHIHISYANKRLNNNDDWYL